MGTTPTIALTSGADNSISHYVNIRYSIAYATCSFIALHTPPPTPTLLFYQSKQNKEHISLYMKHVESQLTFLHGLAQCEKSNGGAAVTSLD